MPPSTATTVPLLYLDRTTPCTAVQGASIWTAATLKTWLTQFDPNLWNAANVVVDVWPTGTMSSPAGSTVPPFGTAGALGLTIFSGSGSGGSTQLFSPGNWVPSAGNQPPIAVWLSVEPTLGLFARVHPTLL